MPEPLIDRNRFCLHRLFLAVVACGVLYVQTTSGQNALDSLESGVLPTVQVQAQSYRSVQDSLFRAFCAEPIFIRITFSENGRPIELDGCRLYLNESSAPREIPVVSPGVYTWADTFQDSTKLHFRLLGLNAPFPFAIQWAGRLQHGGTIHLAWITHPVRTQRRVRRFKKWRHAPKTDAETGMISGLYAIDWDKPFWHRRRRNNPIHVSHYTPRAWGCPFTTLIIRY